MEFLINNPHQEREITDRYSQLLKDSNHVIRFRKLNDEWGNPWEVARNVVDYPVEQMLGYFVSGDTLYPAYGETTSGRNKEFFFIVVDKYKNGDRQVIAAVTDVYGTIPPASVYEELQKQLAETGQEIELLELYVTGNGGAQSLTFKIKGLTGLQGLPDEVEMLSRLDTSVDGTKSHQLTTLIHNVQGDISTSVFGGSYEIAYRHTKKINIRVVDFADRLVDMAANWNDLIMPTMNLIYDQKYNREAAMALLDEVSKDAGIGQRHRETIRKIYKSGELRTNDDTDSLYRINLAIGQFIEDELEGKKELQERFRYGLANSIEKRIKKIDGFKEIEQEAKRRQQERDASRRTAEAKVALENIG